MNEPVHDNLALLYDAFSKEAIDSILPGDHFEVDGVEFVCKYEQGSTSERFHIVKNLALVEAYRQLCHRFSGGRIVELGIAEGGSTALMALLAQPETLIAVDLETTRLEALDAFIRERDLGRSVTAHYGIDQSDRTRLGQLVDDELAGALLDLVVDDCSHQLDPTRSSFETLFPRLRPGGWFVIEDWNADHLMRDAIQDGIKAATASQREALTEQFREAQQARASGAAPTPRLPLERLAMELFVARCSLTDVIASVTVDQFWIIVERGAAPLDADTFRLRDHFTDHFGFLGPDRGR